MIKKEDIEKILNVNNNFKYINLNNNKVLVHARNSGNILEGQVANKKEKRLYSFYQTINNAVSCIRPDWSEEQKAQQIECYLEFMNDLEDLIVKSHEQGHLVDAVELNTKDIEKLLEKHENSNKYFYDFADTIFTDNASLHAIAEYALDMDLKYAHSNYQAIPTYKEDLPAFSIKEPEHKTFVIKEKD